VLTRTRVAAALASGALAVALTPVAPAHAAARITISNDQGSALADDDQATSFTLRGSGFQSVKGGFGGVYVAFGWVRDPAGGGWRPSKGGVTGRDYRYVPDSESEDNAGYLRFVAFPGSSTAGEAQAVMSGTGSFTVQLTVPGPVFDAVDRDGNAVRVDCRQVTCGVITFGAHGVKNASNETFTPVRFGDVHPDETPSEGGEGGSSEESTNGGTSTPTTTGGTGSGTSTDGSGTTPGTAVRRGRPKVVTERATARSGQALAFTGRGFAPGEQVLALLDDGVVALGPLVAGNAGDVAGVMALPVDLAAGTHQLRLIGAASGARPTERFPVRPAAFAAVDPSSDAEPAATASDRDVAAVAFVALAALALVGSLALLVVRLRRRVRRPATAQESVA
jgi:hypothetical protein